MSELGYVLTNEHVIEGAEDILVAFHDGQATRASFVGADPETDLAVIQVDATGLTTLPIVAAADVRVGDIALAIGNPFGIGQTVSLGIVSAKGRTGVSASPYDDFIQTDAAINPGNSGGALIDARGALIGINTLKFSPTQGSEGIGFAIPADLAHSIMMQIVETGGVIRGYLGATLAPDPAPGATLGLEVIDVAYGGPAYRSGVLPGDVIMYVDGRPAASSLAVTRLIADAKPGTPLPLAVRRGPTTVNLTVVLGTRPVR